MRVQQETFTLHQSGQQDTSHQESNMAAETSAVRKRLMEKSAASLGGGRGSAHKAVQKSLSKMSPHDDIQAFLVEFERVAEFYRLPQDQWAEVIAPSLAGRPLRVYLSLNEQDAKDYSKLKEEILASEGKSVAARAQCVHNWTYSLEKSARSQMDHLVYLTKKWLQPEVSTPSQIVERVILDRFVRALPSVVQFWVDQGDPTGMDELVSLVERYNATVNYVQEFPPMLLDPNNQELPSKLSTSKNLELLTSSTNRNQEPENSDVSEDELEILQIKVEKDEPDLEDLKSTKNSAVTLNNGGLPGKEPEMLLIKVEKDDSDFEHTLNPMKGSAITLSDEEDCLDEVANWGSELPGLWSRKMGKQVPGPSGQLKGLDLPTKNSKADVKIEKKLELKSSTSEEDCAENSETLCSICSKCGKAFSVKNDLLTHICVDITDNSFPHSEERSATCSESVESFRTSSKLSSQQNHYTEENSFQCVECGMSFFHESSLLSHHAMHLLVKRFSCTECGKKFCHRSSLLNHERNHKGEKPFTCMECGKSFSRKSSLHSHHKIHTGEKPFACTECGKSFHAKSDLHKHQKSHTGEKPFTCMECGKKFSLNSNLHKHIKIHQRENISHMGKVFLERITF